MSSSGWRRLDLFKSIAMTQEGCLGSGGSVSLTEALSMWGDINVGLGPIASQALSFRDELDGDDKAAVHDFELFWLAVAEARGADRLGLRGQWLCSCTHDREPPFLPAQVAYEMGLRWHAVNMHCLNPINPWKLQVSGELLGLLADPVQHVVWVGGECLQSRRPRRAESGRRLTPAAHACRRAVPGPGHDAGGASHCQARNLPRPPPAAVRRGCPTRGAPLGREPAPPH